MTEANPEISSPRTRGRLESVAIASLAGTVILGGLGFGLERLTFSDINDGPPLSPDVQIIQGTPAGPNYECGDGTLVRLSQTPNSQAVVCVENQGR